MRQRPESDETLVRLITRRPFRAVPRRSRKKFSQRSFRFEQTWGMQPYPSPFTHTPISACGKNVFPVPASRIISINSYLRSRHRKIVISSPCAYYGKREGQTVMFTSNTPEYAKNVIL